MWGAGGNTSNWKSWYGCSEGPFIGERVDMSEEEKKRKKGQMTDDETERKLIK
jgi:hypothetical protein